MSKMNDLSTLLTELSQTGQQLMEAGRTLMLTASRIQDCFPVSEDNEPEPKPKGRKPRKEPEPISSEPAPEPPAETEPEAPAAPEYTKEEIRGMLSDLAGNGHRDEAKALVAKYANGGSFSDIDPAKYPELAEEVKQYG